MGQTVFYAMNITTKTGDKGFTMLYGARRVPKHHSLIEINGQLDKTQVVIGLLKTEIKRLEVLAELNSIQKFLYRMMADVSCAKALTARQIDEQIDFLEKWQIRLNKQIKIRNAFVIPGENAKEALSHLARVETRTAERLISKYSQKYPRLKQIIPYLNRLSDYFFVLSQNLLLKH